MKQLLPSKQAIAKQLFVIMTGSLDIFSYGSALLFPFYIHSIQE